MKDRSLMEQMLWALLMLIHKVVKGHVFKIHCTIEMVLF